MEARSHKIPSLKNIQTIMSESLLESQDTHLPLSIETTRLERILSLDIAGNDQINLVTGVSASLRGERRSPESSVASQCLIFPTARRSVSFLHLVKQDQTA